MKCAEFSWDEVKADKHRENYLGHSVKAPVGRWQKGSVFFSLIPSFSCFFDFTKLLACFSFDICGCKLTCHLDTNA